MGGCRGETKANSPFVDPGSHSRLRDRAEIIPVLNLVQTLNYYFGLLWMLIIVL